MPDDNTDLSPYARPAIQEAARAAIRYAAQMDSDLGLAQTPREFYCAAVRRVRETVKLGLLDGRDAIDVAMGRPVRPRKSPAEEHMRTMVGKFRDLAHSITEYPAEWPDDLLAEIRNMAARVKGTADTELLTRALRDG